MHRGALKASEVTLSHSPSQAPMLVTSVSVVKDYMLVGDIHQV